MMNDEFKADDVVCRLGGAKKELVLCSGPGSYCLVDFKPASGGFKWADKVWVEANYVLLERSGS